MLKFKDVLTYGLSCLYGHVIISDICPHIKTFFHLEILISFWVLLIGDYELSLSQVMSFSGGKCDSKDETDVQAALRETHEELGIPHNQVNVWTKMPEISNHTGLLIWFDNE